MKLFEDIYWITCPAHCEAWLTQELRSLKIEKFQAGIGGVLATLTPEEALYVLAYVRTAGRLFRLIKRFDCVDAEELYKAVFDCPWPEILDVQHSFKVETWTDRSAMGHFDSAFQLSLKVKDALCDRFRAETGERPSVDKRSADYPLLLRLEKSASLERFEASLYLELSGRSLSLRGYRQSKREGKVNAPLRENLAASLILASDWNPEEDLLCDPFCGSATLLIEAILIKAHIPPSYLQLERCERGELPYAFLRQKWFCKNNSLQNYWRSLVCKTCQHARESMQNLPGNQFFGSDVDSKTLAWARQTLQAAAIPKDVVCLKRSDARKLRPPGNAPGVVFSNLPYGKRLDTGDVGELYFEWGENLKRYWKGWRAWLFTGNLIARKRIGLSTSARIPFTNGQLECRLLKYELY